MSAAKQVTAARKRRAARKRPTSARSATAAPARNRGAKQRTAKRGNGNGDAPRNILVIDIGGSKVKMLATGHSAPRRIASGPDFTPERMVRSVLNACKQWKFDAVSIGYPGLAGAQGPRSEPGNLGPGWVGFNFAAAFERPVRIINDAAMQALGSYEGGRMVFLGLGTGLGSALIAQNVIIPLELGALPSRDGEPLGVVLGRKGLKRIGKRAWRRELVRVIEQFTAAFTADYIVIGGGNASLVKKLPAGTRIGNNLAAFRGGFRLWHLPDVPTLSAAGEAAPQSVSLRWRVI
jgi:predicted NBD/HSP70 family sugar kinase